MCTFTASSIEYYCVFREMENQKRCSYCLQELNDMRDPRVLPCTHIFCMSCIQDDCQQQQGLKCPICG